MNSIPALLLAVALLMLPGVSLADSRPSSTAAKIDLKPCEMEGFERLLENLPEALAATLDGAGRGLCGTYQVPENRAEPGGRQIALRIMVLPTTGSEPSADPIYAFAGGPGSSIVRSAWITLVLGGARQERDLVLVDQRGTGESNPLACAGFGELTDLQSLFDPMMPEDVIAGCRKELSKIADLKQYTTEQHVRDVEAVRMALGHGKINLYGGSYGTQPIQEYLRRYPDSVRSAVMTGVSPLDSRPPLDHAAAGQLALDRWLDLCAADAACKKAFPDPRGDLEKVLKRLEEKPAKVTFDADDGKTSTIVLRREIFAEKLRGQMYQARRAVAIPKLLRQAAEGDFEPFVQAVLARERFSFREGDNWFTGLLLSVTCSEALPHFTRAEAAARYEGTIFGSYRVDRQSAACENWPSGEISPGFHEPVRSSVPALLLNGDLDPVTQTSGAELVARHLENGRLIVLPHSGHSPADPACSARLIAEFFKEGSAADLDTSCVEAIKADPWVL